MIYWRYGSGTITAISIVPKLLTLLSGSSAPSGWVHQILHCFWVTEAPEMWRLQSATFKVLALLEFGCSIQKHVIQTNWVNGDAKPPKPPFRLGHVDPHVLHLCCDQLHSIPPTIAQSLHVLLHNYTTKSPLFTMGHPKFTPKTAYRLRWSPPNLIHPSLNRPHSPSQMASGSIQLFCHSTLSGQTHTDRLTDGLGDRSVRIRRTLAILIECNVLIIFVYRHEVLGYRGTHSSAKN